MGFPSHYRRLQVEALEQRSLPGDGLLGAVLGASWLPSKPSTLEADSGVVLAWESLTGQQPARKSREPSASSGDVSLLSLSVSKGADHAAPGQPITPPATTAGV